MPEKRYQYSSDVLAPYIKAMMVREKSLLHPPITLNVLIEAHKRSLSLVQSPEKIVEGYNRLSNFASKVFNTVNTESPGAITGGFLEGLPFCLVPLAQTSGQSQLLVVPKLVKFQEDRLDRFESAAAEHKSHLWVCVPCFSQQQFNPSDEPDISYLTTYCGSCTKVTTEPLKPRDAKFSLVDYDIIFVTNGQLPLETRKRIWEIALAHNFAPIYQHLDKVMTGEMDPIDIWLFNRDEIYDALDQLVTRRDWYNQIARPYDLFRYGATPIGPSNHPDIPFAPDALLQFQPFGESEFERYFFYRMHQLVRQPYFVADMSDILSGKLGADATACGTRMWSNHFLMESGLHYLEQMRIKSFLDMPQNISWDREANQPLRN